MIAVQKVRDSNSFGRTIYAIISYPFTKFIVKYAKNQREEMDYKNIKDQVDALNEKLDVLENNGLGEVEPCIDVFEFNSNAERLKKKIQGGEKESVFFKNVFDTDDYYENISSYLQQTKTSIYYKIEKAGVSLDANKNLQESLKNIQNIMEILVVEYQILVKNSKKSLFFKDAAQKAKIKSLLAGLLKLKSRMKKILHLDSQVISNVVLENFKTIFTFFSNCIIIAKKRDDELLLVEIAGITDKIMAMINPVFSGKSLRTNELIYHYLIYELRELKATAIGENLA